MFINDKVAQIIDYTTSRIEKLRFVNREVFNRTGQKDPEVQAKIDELEDLRSYITIKFYD